MSQFGPFGDIALTKVLIGRLAWESVREKKTEINLKDKR